MRKSYKRINNKWIEYYDRTHETITGERKPCRPVMINGKYYKTMKDASRELDLSYEVIRYRIINQHNGYAYATFEEIDKYGMEKSTHR